MNGIHDMGGMHGFGPIPIERDEPVFHEPWEGRVHGLLSCVQQANPFPNGFRVALESLPPEVYLGLSYYERWLRAWRDGVVRMGLITEAELADEEAAFRAEPDRQVPRREDPERAKAIVEGLRRTVPPSRDPSLVPRFNVGDPVRARNIHPVGHTRLPRYARGRLGAIATYYGIRDFDDAKCAGFGPDPQPMYAVRFEGAELWGPAAEPGLAVYLDMWESYLDPS